MRTRARLGPSIFCNPGSRSGPEPARPNLTPPAPRNPRTCHIHPAASRAPPCDHRVTDLFKSSPPSSPFPTPNPTPGRHCPPPPLPPPSAMGLDEHDLITGYEGYDYGWEPPPSSSSSRSSDDAWIPEPHLVGFVIVNIVGLRYYTGRISGREMVGLVREPLNPYDPNAIKVLNTRSAQVGHLERSAAAVLAPLLDSHLALLEAIVPKPPRNPNPFRLPCQVHVFARPDAAPAVSAAISRGGLQLIAGSDPAFGFSEAAFVLEKKPARSGDEGFLDQIFARVGNEEEGECGGGRWNPMEAPKDVITSKLFPHQMEALGWLLHRETSTDLPPFWEEKDGAYLNVLTNHQTDERPEPLKGGIFADDMGLGKTLTLLSLVAATKTEGVRVGECDEDDDALHIASSGKKRSRVGRKPTPIRKKHKVSSKSFSSDVGTSGAKTTLVVCPPSVFSSWITQLEEHTRPGSLKVYMYYGERTKDATELIKYDIVLTTYTILSAEFGSPDSPMKQIEWLRVVLDEAHLIKNFAAQQTKAVIALKAERRWAVTGTPIQNNSFDLFSLMAFLRFQPFSVRSYWQRLVQRPLDQGSKSGLSRLQALMGTISLRRTKDSQSNNKNLVSLPPKTIETCFIELSAEEREHYDILESEAQNTVKDFIDGDSVMRNYSTVLHIILRLRQICNDMSLCPSNIKSLLPSNALEDVSQNPQLLEKLVSMVQEGDDFDCPVCLSPPRKTVITCCAHIFCQSCILRTLKQVNAHCPICRHSLSKSDLFLAPPPASDEENVVTSERPLSSKVSVLLKLLLASKEAQPSAKSVVFSQFRKFLILLEEPLKAAGFRVLRLDGSMNMKKRTEVIKELGQNSEEGAPTVLLASLKASGVGINLTAASRVYLLEPWWNPAVEEQAMDRVHRIGQGEEVKVVRLIVRNSIEERILELQEKKKKLAKGAFGRKAAKEQRQVHVEDLRTIMRL
ncbi:hypothetical protein Taro_031986 [Colocasia esculenta]|uniref:SWI/SNF-related matrix-associated actin-dependent regulator of chromatin subfamily A member 3-like 1 n=1 Tax=Colocasia esculenta TaxID=4460 RepID=A0A843VRG6_COLES|nr:hypothetical protein [Colocasia esculenta]